MSETPPPKYAATGTCPLCGTGIMVETYPKLYAKSGPAECPACGSAIYIVIQQVAPSDWVMDVEARDVEPR